MTKKLFVLFFIALLAFIPGEVIDAKKKSNGKAKIEFTELSHNYGIIKENAGPVKCEFVFKNTGDGDLLIIDAIATCGCTKPEYPKHPIAPGKKGHIKVTYNPLGRAGAIDRTITIKTNGTPKKVRLKIKGQVVPVK